MKTWKNAELVELNITETANGAHKFFIENESWFDPFDTNDSLLTGGKGENKGEDKGESNVTDPLS